MYHHRISLASSSHLTMLRLFVYFSLEKSELVCGLISNYTTLYDGTLNVNFHGFYGCSLFLLWTVEIFKIDKIHKYLWSLARFQGRWQFSTCKAYNSHMSSSINKWDGSFEAKTDCLIKCRMIRRNETILQYPKNSTIRFLPKKHFQAFTAC